MHASGSAIVHNSGGDVGDDGDVVVFACGCCSLILVSSNGCMADCVIELPLYHRRMEIIILSHHANSRQSSPLQLFLA